MSDTKRENERREDMAQYLAVMGIKFTHAEGRPGRRFDCGCFIPAATDLAVEPCDRHRRAVGK